MSKNQIKIYYIYTLFCFIFISLTTEYLSLEDIIYVANQTDVISYSELAKVAPDLPTDSDLIIKHVAQRFLVPYVIGLTSKLLNIDLFITFKLFTFIFVIFYIYLIDFIRRKLNFNFINSILFFSILFLNPYIVRNHLFQPVQAHDILFFSFGLIFAYTVIKKDYFLNITTIIFCIFLRQTSIAMFLASSIYFIINKKFKSFFILLIIFTLFFLLIINIGNSISSHVFPIHLTYRLLFYDFSNLEKLFKFFLLPLVAFFPLFIFFIGSKKEDIDYKAAYTLLFCCLLMIGQPLAAGPDGSLGNVVRIANLCFPILAVAIFYIFDFSNIFKNRIIFFIFNSGLFFWSMHPTFSTIKIFSILRFYPH